MIVRNLRGLSDANSSLTAFVTEAARLIASASRSDSLYFTPLLANVRNAAGSPYDKVLTVMKNFRKDVGTSISAEKLSTLDRIIEQADIEARQAYTPVPQQEVPVLKTLEENKWLLLGIGGAFLTLTVGVLYAMQRGAK